MGWLLKLICALVLAGIFALCCLSALSIVAAILLPSLAQGDIQITGALPVLEHGQLLVDIQPIPLWHSAMAGHHSGMAVALFILAFMVLLCCVALLLARPLFGPRHRERDAAAYDDDCRVTPDFASLIRRLESLETLLLDRTRRA